jgi:SAM-dependent methyltransferase
LDSTRRFSDRVGDYLRHRPRYPRALIPLLKREIGLVPRWLVADVGSGTGFSAEPFLENGNRVIGVEPNAEMRVAGERLLAHWPGFTSRDGRAEATGLDDQSIDLIVAGQAFHWFDPLPTRAEFLRILRPGGWIAVVWNRRQTDTTEFLRAYETLLLRYGTDYQDIRHDRLGPESIAQFFGKPIEKHVLPFEQILDFEGLKGRLLSSSYTPAAEDPRRQPMLRELGVIFQQYAQDDHVHLLYDTEVYVGQPV